MYLRTVWGEGYFVHAPGRGGLVKQRPSLFQRTLVTVAVGLLVFQLAAGLAMFVNLVLPLGYRSANDLADLVIESAAINPTH